MGLDLAVYKHIDWMKKEYPHLTFKIDAETGECYTDESTEGIVVSEAISIRIGNVSNLRGLREEIENLIGMNSMLFSVVDDWAAERVLSTIEIDQIEREIAELRAMRIHDSLSTFLNSMEQLILASEKQKNPIVFE